MLKWTEVDILNNSNLSVFERYHFLWVGFCEFEIVKIATTMASQFENELCYRGGAGTVGNPVQVGNTTFM